MHFHSTSILNQILGLQSIEKEYSINCVDFYASMEGGLTLKSSTKFFNGYVMSFRNAASHHNCEVILSHRTRNFLGLGILKLFVPIYELIIPVIRRGLCQCTWSSYLIS